MIGLRLVSKLWYWRVVCTVLTVHSTTVCVRFHFTRTGTTAMSIFSIYNQSSTKTPTSTVQYHERSRPLDLRIPKFCSSQDRSVVSYLTAFTNRAKDSNAPVPVRGTSLELISSLLLQRPKSESVDKRHETSRFPCYRFRASLSFSTTTTTTLYLTCINTENPRRIATKMEKAARKQMMTARRPNPGIKQSLCWHNRLDGRFDGELLGLERLRVCITLKRRNKRCSDILAGSRDDLEASQAFYPPDELWQYYHFRWAVFNSPTHGLRIVLTFNQVLNMSEV